MSLPTLCCCCSNGWKVWKKVESSPNQLAILFFFIKNLFFIILEFLKFQFTQIMGNTVPNIPLRSINLTPGNVLILVHGSDAHQAQSVSKGDGSTSYHNLIRGRIIRVGPSISPTSQIVGPSYSNQPAARTTLKPGDEVWVRARKGFPIDIENGKRLFVFNEWDVAINLCGGSTHNQNEREAPSAAPPPYAYDDDEQKFLSHWIND